MKSFKTTHIWQDNISFFFSLKYLHITSWVLTNWLFWWRNIYSRHKSRSKRLDINILPFQQFRDFSSLCSGLFLDRFYKYIQDTFSYNMLSFGLAKCFVQKWIVNCTRHRSITYTYILSELCTLLMVCACVYIYVCVCVCVRVGVCVEGGGGGGTVRTTRKRPGILCIVGKHEQTRMVMSAL